MRRPVAIFCNQCSGRAKCCWRSAARSADAGLVPALFAGVKFADDAQHHCADLGMVFEGVEEAAAGVRQAAQALDAGMCGGEGRIRAVGVGVSTGGWEQPA